MDLKVASYAVGNLAGRARKDAGQAMSHLTGVRKSKYHHVQWNDFNFPCCLNIIHFDLKEMLDPEKPIAKKLYISLWVTFIAGLLNIIFNIIWIIAGIGDARIAYSFFNFIILQPMALYTFYKGYRSMID